MKALNEDENFDLPMTPMIDIVFQLLIFFLLATTIQQEELDVQVRIPSGQQGTPAAANTAPMRLFISVRKDGTIALGNQPLSIDDLRRRLLDAGANNPKPVVHLRGDREAAFGAVARVVQLCQEAKLETVSIQYIKESSQ